MDESGQPLQYLDQVLLSVLAVKPETGKLIRTMSERRCRTMRAQYPDALEPALRELDEAIHNDPKSGHRIKGR